MKKYIFMAVAGMLALSSCSNDDNNQTVQNAPRQMTFTAGFGDEAQTRAALYDNMKKVKFDADDEISILSDNNYNVKFTTSAGGATASFTGSAADDATYYAPQVPPSWASRFLLTSLPLPHLPVAGIQLPLSLMPPPQARALRSIICAPC